MNYLSLVNGQMRGKLSFVNINLNLFFFNCLQEPGQADDLLFGGQKRGGTRRRSRPHLAGGQLRYHPQVLRRHLCHQRQADGERLPRGGGHGGRVPEVEGVSGPAWGRAGQHGGHCSAGAGQNGRQHQVAEPIPRPGSGLAGQGVSCCRG